MAVRFILGRAGSGKTHHFLQEIRALVTAEALGASIYLLLPKQATFQAERELTGMLGGFARVRVVSFEQLGKDILTDCGDIGIPQLTAMGRQMILGHLLRKHQKELRFYFASARRPGLAAELDSTLGEFERAGFDGTKLQELVETLEPSEDPDSSLRDKLHDINLLFTSYGIHIGQDRLDPQRRLKLVLDRVHQCAMLKRAIVFVDDFFDFTGYEQKLLAAVAAVAKRTEIGLLLDSGSPVIDDPRAIMDEMSTFHRTERTYRSLHRALVDGAVKIEPPLVLKAVRRFSAPGLAGIERQLFSNGGGVGDASAIEFMEAPDARAEVDAIARRIRLALREGLRLRDIAVLARNLNSYQELIEASFREHQFLPFFADRRRTARHHPLLQFVHSCILIALRGWPNDAVMTLLKTGLAGVEEDQIDELENYILLHRIRGKMWMSEKPWGFQRELTRSEDEVLPAALTEGGPVDAARNHVVSRMKPFIDAVGGKEGATFREIVGQVFTLLDSFGVRKTLASWMKQAEEKQDFEQLGEDEQVWGELVELFEHMTELLGDEPVSLTDFLEVLENGLENFDLALAPPTVDQILVGEIGRTRTPEVKVVFVVGVNEGEFPHVEREDGVLWDSERRRLRKRNIELNSDSERKLLDEKLLAYVAFTRASECLIVSRCLTDEKGRSRNASIFWTMLRELCPAVKVRQISRPAKGDPDGIGTPRQLVTSLMRWVRDGAAQTGEWPALYQWLATYEIMKDGIGVMRLRAWPALGYANEAQLSRETAAGLFSSPLHAHVAQVETFAACPFQHFVRYGLQLKERQVPDVTALDLSRAYHQVLENLVGDVLKSRKDWCDLKPQDAAEMIHVYTAEIGRTLREELMLSSARNRYLLERIERNMQQAIEAQCEVSRRGQYRPGFASLEFGEGEKLPAFQVETPSGKSVFLRGKIDRVDLHKNGDEFVVADYKLAVGPLALDEVMHGLSLQLLVYLMVVQEGSEELTGRKLSPAAAFFLQLIRGNQAVKHPDDAKAPDHPDFHLRHKPRGIIGARSVESLDRETREGHSPVISFYRSKDGGLGHRNSTDVADEDQFEALLVHVSIRIGELADQMVEGNIRVFPYMMGRETPCPRCDFRSICRFEPGSDRYNFLTPLKRENVLKQITDGGTHGD